jgi:septal ring factor EnvC (AmiA/AmiB activator)
MQADNTAHLHAATQRRRQQTLARASDALDRLAITDEPISVARVAAVASVSRSWLYTQPELLERIEALTQQRPAPAEGDRVPAGQRASSPSLMRRLELAHQRVGQLTEENQRLRDELARAYGRLRA